MNKFLTIIFCYIFLTSCQNIQNVKKIDKKNKQNVTFIVKEKTKTKSKKSIRENITLPKYDFLERFYEETKKTKSGERTARDIRKSYYQ